MGVGGMEVLARVRERNEESREREREGKVAVGAERRERG